MKESRFTEEQIVRILRAGVREDRTVVEVCRSYGISEHTYDRWRRLFRAMAEMKRLRELQRENAGLKLDTASGRVPQLVEVLPIPQKSGNSQLFLPCSAHKTKVRILLANLCGVPKVNLPSR